MGDSRGDGECVALCLNGQGEAFGELVKRYHPAVFSWLNGQLGNCERAEEATQEVFVRAFFSLRSLREPDSFFPWLRGIAGNVLKEERRRPAAVSNAPPEKAESPRTHDDELERAIAQLASPYREVILLRFYSGLSCAEAAERLSVSVGTVTKNLSRAYAMLRDSLKSGGENRR